MIIQRADYPASITRTPKALIVAAHWLTGVGVAALFPPFGGRLA